MLTGVKAYAAGFFDGEGTIGITHRYNKKCPTWHHYLRIQITQKNPEVLEWLCSIWGGSICKTSAKGTYWSTWNLSTKAAACFLSDVLPHLRAKKKQGILALEFSELIRPYRGVGRSRLSNEDVALRHAYKEAIADENRKSYGISKEALR